MALHAPRSPADARRGSSTSRAAGMHFFNPVHKMKLIEVARGLRHRRRRLRLSGKLLPEWGRRPSTYESRPGSSRLASTPASLPSLDPVRQGRSSRA
jgi:3-hydroxyacyl-CoA dehydrogenase, NAD binding domain